MNGNAASPFDEIEATVDRLASALVDGTCTTTEQVRLEALLLDHAEARARFRAFMHTESILAWKFSTPGRQFPQVCDEGGGRDSPVDSGGFLRRRAAGLSAALVAGMATVAAVLVFVIRPVPRPVTVEREPVPFRATLVDATDAVWSGDLNVAVGMAVPQGPIRLVSGAAQVAFESGALVTLNGPAEIEVLGSNRLFLRSGRIVPFVPPAATGFTVVSPTGEVIDLGTEFSVNVDPSGRTDVYVLEGHVDVSRGHEDRNAPLRMSQGFGSRLSVDSTPAFTDIPLIIDHFDDAEGPLRRHDVDPAKPSSVTAGSLHLPIEFRQAEGGKHRGHARMIVDHDFSGMRNRRSAISYKVSLPNDGLGNEHRWMACVIDSGAGSPPMAFESTAAMSVLISPEWQAGVRIDGEPVRQSRVFTRSDEAVGPYQVLLEVDDREEAHRRHGSAVLSVTVNGRELLRNQRVVLGDKPRIGLQTHCGDTNSGRGMAVVDDFSVSLSSE